MKKMLVFLLTAGLLLIQATVYAQSDQSSAKAPPVSQPLVREGDLAVKLAEFLKIGKANNEAEAETILGASGIAPKNGWIADYPVTPDIIGELQKAVSEAADAKKLSMGKEEALKAFRTATVEAGIPIVAEAPGRYAESQPPKNYEYTSPDVVNNYYYEEGPPVITYYPPPWDYWYLYSWVPCPFFFGGFFFSGFFALHDFHRVVIFANKVVVVSNHVINPINKTVVVIDPPTRATGKTLTSTSFTGKTITSTSALQRKGTTGFTSADTRKAAASILERSQQRLGTGSMTRMTGQTNQFSPGRVAPSTTSRTTGVTQGQTLNTTISQGSSGGGERSVNTSNVSNGKPLSGPSTSRTVGSSGESGRSFSPPSRSFSPPSGSHSFGGSSGGHSFGGFSSGHGGFSGGHSFGRGFSGGGGGFHGGGRR